MEALCEFPYSFFPYSIIVVIELNMPLLWKIFNSPGIFLVPYGHRIHGDPGLHAILYVDVPDLINRQLSFVVYKVPPMAVTKSLRLLRDEYSFSISETVNSNRSYS